MKNGIMKTGKEKASAGTLAGNNKHRKGIYHNPVPLSNLKMQIGEILLVLLSGNEQPDGWQEFEQFLGNLYDGGVWGN